MLANLLEVERDLERFAGPSAGAVADLLAEPLADEMTRGTALRFGALLHDSAKPLTRQAHDGGRVSFKGHDREGVAVVRAAFSRLKASRALSRYVEGLTLHHLHLGFMVHERPLPRRRLYDYLKLCEPVAADVTVLTIADRLAARGSGPIAAEEIVQAHLELAREVLPEALAWHRDGPPRSPIAGDELAEALGIEPGPRARGADRRGRGRGVHRRRGDAPTTRSGSRGRRARADGLRRRRARSVLLVEDLEQRSCRGRAELRSGVALDLGPGALLADRRPVGAVGAHRVVGVADQRHPARERDLLAREAVRIALAVPALVLGPDRAGEMADRRGRGGDLGAARRDGSASPPTRRRSAGPACGG